MNQPTSIQMLDAEIWQELGGEKAHDTEAGHHTVGTLLSRWLVARSDYPEMEEIKLFCKGSGLCCPSGTFLKTIPLKNSLSSRRLAPRNQTA
jgi:hypothetical protein